MLTAICVLLGVIIIELLFVGIFVYDMAFRTGQQLRLSAYICALRSLRTNASQPCGICRIQRSESQPPTLDRQ